MDWTQVLPPRLFCWQSGLAGPARCVGSPHMEIDQTLGLCLGETVLPGIGNELLMLAIVGDQMLKPDGWGRGNRL